MEMTLFFVFAQLRLLVLRAKGKTTTSTLTAFLLAAWRPDTVPAGNMRISALAQLAQITPTTPVVLELSSFVLEGLDTAGLSPAYAAITNIHPDHLDRYGNMNSYIAAKRQSGRHQRPHDTLVLHSTDPVLQSLAPTMPGQIYWSGTTAPTHPRHGDTWWQDDTLYCESATGAQVVAQASDVQLAGMHSRANVAMAVALALQVGMPVDLIAPALRRFEGVEHRQERVATINGHTFVNDTAATVPDAAMVALACMPKPIVWIAGGADKKLMFAELAAVSSPACRSDCIA
jgi:UDP-N-acetylmuramoylalanine--D-glutamate ligase